eukprot:scaffold47026_cov113-Cyclotella_meneghiniana.AAC.6
MKALRSISKTHHLERDIPMLVMSATYRIPEQKAFNVLIDDLPEIVMWGDMNSRNVGIFGSVVGEPLSLSVIFIFQDLQVGGSAQDPKNSVSTSPENSERHKLSVSALTHQKQL